MKLRTASPADAEATRAIYNREVLGSTVTFDLVPRSLDDQIAWLEKRGGVHVAVVAVDDDDQVLGFGSLSPYRDRPAYSTTVEDSVYVHHQHHGRGVGKAILTELVERAAQHGFHTVMARIVGGHETSIALHRRVGFEVVGTERQVGRKFGQWLDVVSMQKMLTPGADTPA